MFKSITNKTWEYIKIARIELIIITVIIMFDLLSKGIAQHTINNKQQIFLISKYFSFYFSINPNSTFGLDWLMENPRLYFTIKTIIGLIIFSYFLYRFRGKCVLLRLPFAFIIAGIFGNGFDRLFIISSDGYYGVRDFLRVDLFINISGNVYTVITNFNIADVSLDVGLVFVIYTLFKYKSDIEKWVNKYRKNVIIQKPQ